MHCCLTASGSEQVCVEVCRCVWCCTINGPTSDLGWTAPRVTGFGSRKCLQHYNVWRGMGEVRMRKTPLVGERSVGHTCQPGLWWSQVCVCVCKQQGTTRDTYNPGASSWGRWLHESWPYTLLCWCWSRSCCAAPLLCGLWCSVRTCFTSTLTTDQLHDFLSKTNPNPR